MRYAVWPQEQWKHKGSELGGREATAWSCKGVRSRRIRVALLATDQLADTVVNWIVIVCQNANKIANGRSGTKPERV
jgi:hypothetical protein